MAYEEVNSATSRHSYRALVNEVFTKCKVEEKVVKFIVEEKVELVKIKYEPTMAESLYSSSTLSSMRTHAKKVHFSSRTRPSYAESNDELKAIPIRGTHAATPKFEMPQPQDGL